MLAIAHRGCMDDYPENTAAAFRAVGPKADIVEFDVQRCGSGELVVFHDETLERVTGRSGRVDETDWTELSQLEIHDSGERMPLLSEALAAVPAGTTVTVEMKSADIAEEVVAKTRPVDNDVIVSSFRWNELRSARDAGAETLAVLCPEETEEALSIAEGLGADYIHPPKEACLGTDLVPRAHERGVQVNVWTVDTKTDVEEMSRAGVDGVSTNRVGILDLVRSRDGAE